MLLFGGFKLDGDKRRHFGRSAGYLCRLVRLSINEKPRRLQTPQAIRPAGERSLRGLFMQARAAFCKRKAPSPAETPQAIRPAGERSLRGLFIPAPHPVAYPQRA